MECHEDKFTFLVLITHLIGAKLGLNVYIAQEQELHIKPLIFFIIYFFMKQRILLNYAPYVGCVKLYICGNQYEK